MLSYKWYQKFCIIITAHLYRHSNQNKTITALDINPVRANSRRQS
uniref:Uncharacterized protein n=1 Tax=Physcomitrium patens TaxID=3218 RepID=A0A2K1K6A1_PHYPA|nr:hypothetical protein PHYPA_011200 [Physcomitrium patens]